MMTWKSLFSNSFLSCSRSIFQASCRICPLREHVLTGGEQSAPVTLKKNHAKFLLQSWGLVCRFMLDTFYNKNIYIRRALDFSGYFPANICDDSGCLYEARASLESIILFTHCSIEFPVLRQWLIPSSLSRHFYYYLFIYRFVQCTGERTIGHVVPYLVHPPNPTP